MNWNELNSKIVAESEKTLLTPPEEVVRALHYQFHDQQAGTDNLAFGTWYYAVNDVRYVSIYLHHILELSMNDTYNTEHLKTLFLQMIPSVAEFTGFCGFRTLWQFVDETSKVLKKLEDRNDVLELLNSLFQYSSNLNAWTHHYMPWRIGFLFPNQTKEEIREMTRFANKETNE